MVVPFSWLKDYVDIDVSAEELQAKLFSCGFEVENLTYLGKDVTGVVTVNLCCTVIADKSGLRRPFQWIKSLSVEFISPDQHLCTEGTPNANDSQSRANRHSQLSFHDNLPVALRWSNTHIGTWQAR